MSNFTRKKTMFDTHNHCEFSCDSKMTLQQAADTAAKLGIGIILTEHWDYEYPTNPEQFLFDREAYFKRTCPCAATTFCWASKWGCSPIWQKRKTKCRKVIPLTL